MSNRKRPKMAEIVYKYSLGWDSKSDQPLKGEIQLQQEEERRQKQRHKLQEETLKNTFD